MRIVDRTFKIILSVFIIAFMIIDLQAQNNQSESIPQFLFPKFSKGIVKMKTGNTYSAILDYNMLDEEMIFAQDGVFMVLDKPEDIDTVFLQNRKFVPVKNRFYEVLVDGVASFYIQYKSRYASVGTTSAYGTTSQVNAPTKVHTIKGGNQVREIDHPDNVAVTSTRVNWVRKKEIFEDFTTERQLFKIFPEKETQLKEFIKKEKLNLKVREDLIKIGNYCNELLK